MPDELQAKASRLQDYCEKHQLDGVLLTRRDNFAWITCGRDNHIANNTTGGFATILATRDGKRICLANTIEAPRMKQEELAGTGIETIDFPWHDGEATKKTVGDVIGGRKFASDSETFGLSIPQLPNGFDELRWSLTDAEIERYRIGGRRAAAAMEKACREIRPGASEHEAAALLDFHVHKAGMNPLVTLVASDERITNFRHPIPTDHSIRRHVMLVSCAEFRGLISCLTRCVHFGAMPTELKAKHEAACNIDAIVNLVTKSGRTFGMIFDELRNAYADAGYPDEWKLHHQGGSTGYNNRERVATPGNNIQVMENQAFAWNPSITGTKSEDTVLCASAGIEVLTSHSAEWPSAMGKNANGQTLRRADVLVV